MQKIENRIIDQKLINWRDCEWLQSSSLKDDDPKLFEKLQNSLIRNHFIDAFKVWENPKDEIIILDGRTRKLGMLELESKGFKIDDQLPADFINCESEKEAAQLVLVFNSIYNRITQEGLQSHIDLNKLVIDELQEFINIDGIDLNMLFAASDKTVKELNEIPDPPAEPISKKGDLFLIGKHRLLCGDSRSEADVKLLMNSEKADMTFTDPPYNLCYGGVAKKKFKEKFIAGDGLSQAEFYEFLNDYNINIKLFCKDGAAIYEWIDWRQYSTLFEVMKKHFHIEQCIVWDKTFFRMGGHYRNQHEFMIAGFNETINDSDQLYADIHECIVYAANGKKITKWFGGKSESNIWYIKPAASQTYVHPTQKPIELSQRAIKNSSFQGDIVFDTFLGSGSTLVGAHELKRKCYGLELDPIYIDVILKRFIGLYPDVEIKCANREFDFSKL